MPEPQSRDEPGEITRLLRDASQGDKEAFDRLLPRVYHELHRVAHAKLRFERPGHTLNTTALVHETYLRLIDQSRVEWRGRSHFFAVASEAMRRILIDYAKRRGAAKRGAGAIHLELEAAEEAAAVQLFTEGQADELLALDQALERLAEFNPWGARVVQYRFFGGLSAEETAEVLDTSERTIRRTWTVAKAWLRQELAGAIAGEGESLLRPQLDPATRQR